MELSHLLLLLFFILTSNGISQAFNPSFSKCAPLPFVCGTSTFNISYPFQVDNRPDYCGYTGYSVNCTGNAAVTITISNKPYQITSIDYPNNLLNIVDTSFVQQSCPQSYTNTTIDTTLFEYSDRDRNLTLYINCTSSTIPFPSIAELGCLAGVTGQHSYYRLNNGTVSDVVFGGCASIVEVPLDQETAQELVNGNLTLTQALQKGFFLSWTAGADWCGYCVSSGGYCGHNSSSSDDHTCFCPDGTFIGSCDQGSGSSSKKLIVGIVCGVGGFILACVFCFFCYRRRLKKHTSPVPLFQDISSKSFSKKDRESISFHCQTHLFSYQELKEATNDFDASKELGDGGYGTVYKGHLRDGRIVAVKRLYETSYKRVEQFMNEVEILSRLRHPNLVTLYGSTSPNSPHLLLVYEYISNGTLADHLHNPLHSKSLSLSLRLSMAIDTAVALSYLHSIDIIHRDVKTNNILVDNNFNVKVADFGLSRLFPPNATHVSTAPQGTPGYLDPEYHRFYQLTDKSDVYSFGVVLMELISSRPAVDIDRRPNEISLAMASINKIHNGELDQLVDPGLRFNSDQKVNIMITQMAELAFRCLQMDREMRPSIKEVLEGLKEIQQQAVSCNSEQCEVKVREESRLLKNSAPFSPDSVMNKWLSRSTTPSTSNQGIL